MSAPLPPELGRAAAWCGARWPQADERAMHRAARAWREAADAEADLAARAADCELRAEAAELAAIARECRVAADRLEHAAEQVAAAKGQLLAVLRAVSGAAEAVSAGSAAPAALDGAVRHAGSKVEQIRRALIAAVDPGSGVRIPPVSPAAPAGHDTACAGGGEVTGPVRVRPVAAAQQTAQRNRRSPLRPLPARSAGNPQRPRSSRGPEAVSFVLHQFPIGYLPVAASGPSSQDCASASADTYPPRDHPRAALVGDAEALRRPVSGPARAPAASRGPAEPPAEVVAGAGPPDDGSEQQDRPGSPERGGVAVVLEPDLELDLFGSGAGRIAFTAGTPFEQRSLPHEHLRRDYRRYRVLRELPAWCSTAQPGCGQPGGGVRYRTTFPMTDLVGLGYLVELGTAPEGGQARAEPAGTEAATLRIAPGAQEAAT